MPCFACGGDKIACTTAAASQLADFASQGACFAHAAGLDDRARRASLAAAGGILQAIVKAETTFRHALIAAPGMSLTRAALPRGIIVYAQVRDTFKAPDGQYTLLVPAQRGPLLAVRDDAFPPTGVPGVPRTGGPPFKADWVLLAGIASQTFNVEKASTVYVHPFLWLPAPDLGDAPLAPPRRRGPPRDPAREPADTPTEDDRRPPPRERAPVPSTE